MSHKCFQHTRENTKSRKIYWGDTIIYLLLGECFVYTKERNIRKCSVPRQFSLLGRERLFLFWLIWCLGLCFVCVRGWQHLIRWQTGTTTLYDLADVWRMETHLVKQNTQRERVVCSKHEKWVSQKVVSWHAGGETKSKCWKLYMGDVKNLSHSLRLIKFGGDLAPKIAEKNTRLTSKRDWNFHNNMHQVVKSK